MPGPATACSRRRRSTPAAARLADPVVARRSCSRWRRSSSGAVPDLLELAEEQLDLLGFRIEVRRDPDPDAGAVIAEEPAAVELAADIGRADEGENDRAAALVIRTRRVELHAELVDPVDHLLGHHERLVADLARTDLADDLLARTRLVQRGDRGRAAHVAPRRLGVGLRRHRERERRLVAEP